MFSFRVRLKVENRGAGNRCMSEEGEAFIMPPSRGKFSMINNTADDSYLTNYSVV